MLKANCRKVVSMGGGSVTRVDLDELITLARDGTVIEFVHAFLLADPRAKKKKGGMQAEFRAALAKLERRGARVVDADGCVCSQKQRKAFLLLVDSDITRSNRGAKSATNGARSRGRPTYEPTVREQKDAKGIWHNLMDYPEWDDADKAIRKQVNERFTAFRAYELWGARRPSK